MQKCFSFVELLYSGLSSSLHHGFIHGGTYLSSSKVHITLLILYLTHTKQLLFSDTLTELLLSSVWPCPLVTWSVKSRDAIQLWYMKYDHGPLHVGCMQIDKRCINTSGLVCGLQSSCNMVYKLPVFVNKYTRVVVSAIMSGSFQGWQ